jgi:hypothetical protein
MFLAHLAYERDEAGHSDVVFLCGAAIDNTQ